MRRQDSGPFWFCAVIWFGLGVAIAGRGGQPSDRDLTVLLVVNLAIVLGGMLDLRRRDVPQNRRVWVAAALLLVPPAGFFLWWRWGLRGQPAKT